MVGQFYKGVNIESHEPVNYVGVHPLIWHDHPDQPDLGFSEMELKEILDSLTDDERNDLFSNYCRHCGSMDATCQCWNDE